MQQLVPNPPPGFDQLSIEKQIEYLQLLWERIAATPSQVPVPEWHAKVLKERLEAHRQNPGQSRPWADVRTDVEKELRDRRAP